jgi:hypothetical protein
MSGAAVWAADRIVGVVAEHHPGEGTGRLTARRVDRIYAQPPVPGLDVVAGLLGMPLAAPELADVIPADDAQLVRSAYLAQVEGIAPDELVGRESELAEWAEFCAGPDRYAWWQAAPWAGKSALASWFVIRPPADVDVVSFFVTGRLSGQANSDAFLDAMTEQLRALQSADPGAAAPAGARAGTWLSLLATAAARAEEQKRRLVVVIDGLDEDDAGAAPLRGKPSIASLLPRRPPPGARFIVTSRPDPGLPDDLPIGHPLRACTPRALQASWVAEDIGVRARQELRDLLAGDQIAVDVVGFIAGSGGGLTGGDLSDLIGAPPHMLEPLLRGVTGRSLQTLAAADARVTADGPAATVYLFAHETLRVSAVAQLGMQLHQYRKKVHEWIDSYARDGWPEATPDYAARGYPGLLEGTADATRLLALASDPRRHDFLLRASGSDYAALTEISAAQALISGQATPDLKSLAVLAAHRHVISLRNQSIPRGLAAVWARLGHLHHAESLARTITDPNARAGALREVAVAAAQAGALDDAVALARAVAGPARAWTLNDLAVAAAEASEPDRANWLTAEAETAARALPDADDQARALIGLAVAAMEAGDTDRARRLAAEGEATARTAITPEARERRLRALAAAAAKGGDLDYAEALASDIASPYDQARTLTDLTEAAQARDPDRARRLAAEAEAKARDITSPYTRARALSGLVGAAAQAGDVDRARRLAAEVETAARDITSPHDHALVLTRLAAAAAQAGDFDRAEALADNIAGPTARAQALSAAAAAAAEAGDADGARRLSGEAAAIARRLVSPDARDEILGGLAVAAAEACDVPRAVSLAHDISSIPDRAQALTFAAGAAADAGEIDLGCRLARDAGDLARTITSRGARDTALGELAVAAAHAGHADSAVAVARDITTPYDQALALSELAILAAQAGEFDTARRLAADAENVTRTLADADQRAWALSKVAAAAMEAGDAGRAETLARAIASLDANPGALSGLVRAAARLCDLDRAEAFARGIAGADERAVELTGLAAAAAQAGERRRARRLMAEAEPLAREISNTRVRILALGDVAAAAAQAGDADHARRLAAEAETLARTITSSDAQTRVLSRLAAAATRAGDLDRAEALARAIVSPRVRAQTLSALAVAAAQAADVRRAEAVAGLVSGPDAQARALSALAAAVARAGDLEHAARFLARELVLDLLGLWWVAAVSRLFPSAIEDAWGILATAYSTRTQDHSPGSPDSNAAMGRTTPIGPGTHSLRRSRKGLRACRTGACGRKRRASCVLRPATAACSPTRGRRQASPLFAIAALRSPAVQFRGRIAFHARADEGRDHPPHPGLIHVRGVGLEPLPDLLELGGQLLLVRRVTLLPLAVFLPDSPPAAVLLPGRVHGDPVVQLDDFSATPGGRATGPAVTDPTRRRENGARPDGAPRWLAGRRLWGTVGILEVADTACAMKLSRFLRCRR